MKIKLERIDWMNMQEKAIESIRQAQLMLFVNEKILKCVNKELDKLPDEQELSKGKK